MRLEIRGQAPDPEPVVTLWLELDYAGKTLLKAQCGEVVAVIASLSLDRGLRRLVSLATDLPFPTDGAGRIKLDE